MSNAEATEENAGEDVGNPKRGGVPRPKSRKQRRDVQVKEREVARLKSIKKELKAEEALPAENEKKRKAAKEKKIPGHLRLSNN